MERDEVSCLCDSLALFVELPQQPSADGRTDGQTDRCVRRGSLLLPAVTFSGETALAETRKNMQMHVEVAETVSQATKC